MATRTSPTNRRAPERRAATAPRPRGRTRRRRLPHGIFPATRPRRRRGRRLEGEGRGDLGFPPPSRCCGATRGTQSWYKKWKGSSVLHSNVACSPFGFYLIFAIINQCICWNPKPMYLLESQTYRAIHERKSWALLMLVWEL